ncbi:expressed unknown protein [Seminavis robusta]|uniref:CRAL-TRIO domain-containing protein n=1 Tax=Seminavis robusta TaxID=568900 RepID=A0A9N8HYJ2_9STRA|nr:expressed unknown protein [Seminavis robusta]|eukprot:Sro2878_g339180.1 n/a (306) ;mRNA; f:3095-4012
MMEEQRQQEGLAEEGRRDEARGEEEPQEEPSPPFAPLSTFHPFDESRMELTPEERQWALEIKQAIKDTPDLDPLSDFRIAQLAVIERGDTEAALDRALHLQGFRQEYDILDAPADGRKFLQRLIKLFPRMFLSLSFNPDDGDYHLVYDITQFSVRSMNTTRDYTSWHAGVYYLCHCMTVDFQVMRRGVQVLTECEGYDWTRNVDARTFQRDWLELAMYYPLKFQKIRNHRAGVLFNMFVALLKPIVPKRLSDTFGGNVTQLDARLDTYYLVPTVEIANQRLLSRLEQILKRRYYLEKSFSLSPSS